jgi:hypothetical protein
MNSFRKDFNEALVETFADDGISSDHSEPAESLEARDIWNSHNIVYFMDLSKTQKKDFVDAVSLAVDNFNFLFDMQLVVHPGTVTVYRDTECMDMFHKPKTKTVQVLAAQRMRQRRCVCFRPRESRVCRLSCLLRKLPRKAFGLGQSSRSR